MTSPTTSAASTRPHRDADEEALQAALAASVQRDFLAEILQAEEQEIAARASSSSAAAADTETAESKAEVAKSPPADTDEGDEAENDNALATQLRHTCMDDDKDDDKDDVDDGDDANSGHQLLNFADYLLVDILRFLDEDSVGSCLCACRRLQHVARADELFETLCRRIFPAQNPRVAVAAAANRFALRRFRSWFEMLRERPRVRHNGFYWLRISYYKKPELNMWTDITPGTILQVVYYRYFSFQRDGSVLYGMLFKPPHEAAVELRERRKDVFVGRYHVDRDEVFVSVPTPHNVVEFRFTISKHGGRGKNVKLILGEHYSFSEPDRTGWVDYYHTNEEEFQYYRSWNL